MKIFSLMLIVVLFLCHAASPPFYSIATGLSSEVSGSDSCCCAGAACHCSDSANGCKATPFSFQGETSFYLIEKGLGCDDNAKLLSASVFLDLYCVPAAEDYLLLPYSNASAIFCLDRYQDPQLSTLDRPPQA